MQNKKIFWLIIIPSVVAVILYFLNSVVGPLTHGNPIGLFGNFESIWFIIIPGGIGICGLFLTLIIVPLLFRGSFVRWKNNDSSWWIPLILTLIVGVLGVFMNLPFGYVALATIPLSLIAFAISLLATLVAAGKVNIKSTFFLVNLTFLAIPVIGYFLISALFSGCCH